MADARRGRQFHSVSIVLIPDSSNADLDWQNGQPVSRRFGDVYFSRQSGLGESRHVFLAGNRLAERWSSLPRTGCFTIAETGFGTGLNFLAAAGLWRTSAPPGTRLHFVSVERYPLARSELRRALDLWPELASDADGLVRAWDDWAPGWHRLTFAEGRIRLTLIVGDARVVLPELDARVDAWFLDGFAPARNPEMWGPELFASMGRLSAPEATFATFTVAGSVRRGLEAAGFDTRKLAGFGSKREMLAGGLRARTARPWSPPWFASPAPAADRRAIVVGAGLAGCLTAASLGARGWDVTVLERRSRIADEASGNHQGVLYAHPTATPSSLNTLVLSGLQHTVRLLRSSGLDHGADFDLCGVLQLAFDPAEAQRQARVAALGLPASLLHALDAAAAGEAAGIPVDSPALLFPDAGWVHPPALCRWALAQGRARIVLAADATRLTRNDDGWRVESGDGTIAEAPVVVVAAAGELGRFGALGHLPLRSIRGQITHVPATAGSAALRTVLTGRAYVAPPRAGVHSLGATHTFRDLGTDVRTADNAENLAGLRALSPALYDALHGGTLDPAMLDGRAGLRWSSPDYLPIVGPVVDAARFAEVYAPLARDASLRLEAPPPWLDGLYVNAAHGSRGLVTAPIAGEMLAAVLDAEPCPLPLGTMLAQHPSRFPLRALVRRRGKAR